ncbi:DNA (cytosine-5-)-methyltransferase [Streptococcus sp. CF8-6]|uniref:DNA (cytosine-5-)-methyltransferase n=1 Tax=Streptococcus sp. CF8-6 TaxID=2963150 RepID=UPI0020C91AB3|nr:DNA (cytosine-5-)-methyltransferase [Streptococcus sp. CF8-6]MCP9018123.1 DNA (cytosine-5-)-methyltransferase [Streptococcus sp. CF8-6]
MKVLELFAGVGGFRLGLENADKDFFKTLWANQWDPGKKSQEAFEVYDYHFSESENINISISDITDDMFSEMNADLIVGGFPCQDYSVARSKKDEKGIEGEKGVLFWEIIRATKIISPKCLILENVDRLLKSPSKQRGRDFAIMLKAFDDLGYSVEWRVINAADYGRAQRRKRIFFFIFRNDTDYSRGLGFDGEESFFEDYVFRKGLFATQFPVKSELLKNRKVSYELVEDIFEISNLFTGIFWNSGFMRYGKCYSFDTIPDYNFRKLSLGDVIEKGVVDEKYYITDPGKLEKIDYLRSAKKINRVSKDGFSYIYSEGGMSPYDSLDLPARTMLTSEGTVNRSSHLIKVGDRYRFLTPIEAERLQDFPDNWTEYKRNSDGMIEKVKDRMRMFFMGNALVTDIVKEIGYFIRKVELEGDK